jgi:hypothetical protein
MDRGVTIRALLPRMKPHRMALSGLQMLQYQETMGPIRYETWIEETTGPIQEGTLVEETMDPIWEEGTLIEET